MMQRWADLTWTELAALERVVAFLPVGATEAHGPHLPLGTDNLIAESMAEEAALHLPDHHCLLLPALHYTPAPFAQRFPGTLTVSPQTLQALIVDLGEGVRAVGGTLAIANAHLDPANLQALEGAARELRERGLRVAFPNVVRRRLAQRLGEEFQSGACHAGRYETSLVLDRRPELVRSCDLEPNPASLSTAIAQGLSSFEEAGGPRAYFGDPAAATAAEGRQQARELGLILWEAIRDALAG